MVIVNLTMIWHTNNMIATLFDGFYSADPVFCEEGGLEMMIVYFDASKNSSLFSKNSGDGYIMIKGADESILLNDVIQYNLECKSSGSWSLSEPCLYQITFKGIEYQDFFPTTQMLEFIPSTQRIKLYDDDEKKIHAILYKNNAITDVKSLLPTD